MKTIKVIDLLSKIANGEEVPKKVFYKTGSEYTGGYYWNYDENFRDYKDKAGDYVFNAGKYHVIDMLNMEVEIIEEDKAPTFNNIREQYGLPRVEEDKKIEEIDMFDNFTGYDYENTNKELLEDLQRNFEILNGKINEIIDYINKNEEGK